jgi:segregation and condensation protein B
MDAQGAVEAALFSSGEPLRPIDIAEKAGLDEGDVKNALKILEMDYDRRGSAIEIVKINSGYMMQLRSEYREFASFSEKEMSKGLLKTAVAIAYHQPVMQSELANQLGPRVYEDVKELIEKDLIHAKQKGQTKELTTTKHFSEYFGIEGTGKEAVRKWIEKMEKR